MPVFPSVDLTKWDLAKLDLTKLDLTKLGLTNLEIPKLARDAAYVAIGLGVLTFQEAQVRRRDLTKALDRAATSARSQVRDLWHHAS